jgi:hypothetical protein
VLPPRVGEMEATELKDGDLPRTDGVGVFERGLRGKYECRPARFRRESLRGLSP